MLGAPGSTMNGLLIVAHGSRRNASNDEVRELTTKVAPRLTQKFELISCAFLELAEPSIPEGINQLVEKGATTLVVVPYFLANGTHVAMDIPNELAKAAKAHPLLDITVSDYLGASDTMPDLLVNLALQSSE